MRKVVLLSRGANCLIACSGEEKWASAPIMNGVDGEEAHDLRTREVVKSPPLEKAKQGASVSRLVLTERKKKGTKEVDAPKAAPQTERKTRRKAA